MSNIDDIDNEELMNTIKMEPIITKTEIKEEQVVIKKKKMMKFTDYLLVILILLLIGVFVFVLFKI